jgi:hypothetical protein
VLRDSTREAGRAARLVVAIPPGHPASLGINVARAVFDEPTLYHFTSPRAADDNPTDGNAPRYAVEHRLAPWNAASATACIGPSDRRRPPPGRSPARRHPVKEYQPTPATNGVLFLDEVAEFHADVLDSLRQPLEEGVVRVARASHRTTFPARFQLVAAMNPCPCGDGGSPGGCRCGEQALARYRRRLSGPLVDRFDLRVPVARPDARHLVGGGPGETTATVAERVLEARARAAARGVRCNALLTPAGLDQHAPLASETTDRLEALLRVGRISARGLQRVRRVALTLADLAGDTAPLRTSHFDTAIGLRCEPITSTQRLAG